MSRWPSLFISHGAPTYALAPGLAGAQLRALGASLTKPQAVLVMSPHWITRGIGVCTQATTETLHDFGGFPEPLYSLQYTPPGAPDFARRTLTLLQSAGIDAKEVPRRPLDHGVWVPVSFLLPDANVPVFQVSMPHDLTPARAMQLGAAVRALASEGVLIVGSGSLTHNLHEVQMESKEAAPYVSEFVGWVRAAVTSGDLAALAYTMERAPHAQRAHPSLDHLLPLMFAAGAADLNEPNGVLEGGIEHGNLSMESYVFGSDVFENGSLKPTFPANN